MYDARMGVPAVDPAPAVRLGVYVEIMPEESTRLPRLPRLVSEELTTEDPSVVLFSTSVLLMEYD